MSASPRLGHLALAAVLGSVALVACGSPRAEPMMVTSSNSSNSKASSRTSGDSTAGVEGLWRTRCGQCHAPVEPKTRERGMLAQALERHKKRARLTESDVRELVDFLAQ